MQLGLSVTSRSGSPGTVADLYGVHWRAEFARAASDDRKLVPPPASGRSVSAPEWSLAATRTRQPQTCFPPGEFSL